ncbi:FHA domain-containing protein [Frateuria sp.]|uniref:FHA domain-containing protein n=1 Tax=Frateuria sp. TaxID=2211372 RepID=UPI001802191E|nr:FHA domain-containing protein [Frateuria sp.]NUR21706.1 FHA domain-containing protein [Frateuria sp.]
MRIEFPNSAREDFRWAQAALSIGSAPDNDLVVSVQQGAAHHLRIRQDRRGWMLEVLSGAGRVYVNARPVRERALLRPGDILSLGDCRMLLCADEDPASRAPLALAQQSHCTAALRAVAGPLSGRVFPVRERLEFGPQGDQPLDLPQAASATLALFWKDGELHVAAGPTPPRYPLRLNGVPVEQAVLHPDDQLGIAMHRFLVDAPGLLPSPVVTSHEPLHERLPEDAAGPRGEVWWLIATAAVLALLIALILLVRF